MIEEFPDLGLNGDFHFFYSIDGKAERPINIVIYKRDLLPLATKRFVIPISK
ncbi:hypothetical protein [uncultured Methanolobus sp.]|uniref:hypothetical protein n=1 Tax=uncultured Methanolobus sp. TaxID=218300 RepID=UPI00374A4E5D